jgi:hypothetical protein
MKKADNFNPGKWLVENKITSQSRLNENQKENYLNSLLEKIFEEGIDSLSLEEKEYLDSVSKGTNSKTPNEYLQDLFKEWKNGEIEAGNDIDNIYQWSDLHNFDQELQDGFLSYVDLVKKYPKLDKEDLAMLNSLSYQKEFNGTPIYTPYSDIDWNSLDEKTYHKILFNEFGIEPYEDDDEDYDGSDEAYIKEFGFSWEEKQNWEEIKDQVFEKNKFDWFKPSSNYGKIEDEAKQAYIDKYGSPKYKRYPF